MGPADDCLLAGRRYCSVAVRPVQRLFRYANNEPPDTEFIFARWEYQDGRGGWAHDYPDAEEHLNQIMDEATGVNVERMSYRIVQISSDEIFDYPSVTYPNPVRCG